MKKYLFVLCVCLSTSIFAAEIVVSAGDPNTSSTGTWSRATGASMAYNGNQGMYASISNGISTYTFTPNLPLSTIYTVEVFNSCYTPRSHRVLHSINHAGGTNELFIEQDCQIDPYVGRWRTLGQFSFNAGTSSSLTIDTTGSDNTYVGATAVRFIYDDGSIPINTAPTLSTSLSSVTANEGSLITLTATANDSEDGDITQNIQWSALGQTGTGASFSLNAGANDFNIDVSVSDTSGLSVSSTIAVNVLANTPPVTTTMVYDFDCTQLNPLPANFVTNKPEVLPDVGIRCGKYIAELKDNTADKTLHFNNLQGRFDGVLVGFPFTVIVRNIGIAPLNDANANHQYQGNAYIFTGIQVHHNDFNRLNSAHLVVGQRGGTPNTIEGKTTLSGTSVVTDIGPNRLPNGRADLMIVGDSNGELLAYWQVANTNNATDTWQLYNTTGRLPGTSPQWDGNSVYIGLITYAQGLNGLPFMGVADSLSVEQ